LTGLSKGMGLNLGLASGWKKRYGVIALHALGGGSEGSRLKFYDVKGQRKEGELQLQYPQGRVEVRACSPRCYFVFNARPLLQNLCCVARSAACVYGQCCIGHV
jgi:hypothetical protein